MVRVNDELDTARPEFILSRTTNVTPSMVDATFARTVIGAGAYGMVFAVTTRDSAQRRYALKVEAAELGSGHREAAVGMLMTALYAAGQNPEPMRLPVIKFYDSGTGVWDREQVLNFFGGASPTTRDLMEFAFPDDTTPTATVNLSLMELSGGTSLNVFIRDQQRAFRPHKQYKAQKPILDIVVQLLLTLANLQKAFEFVHYDIHSGNIKIETDTTKNYVWHYTVSSDTSFNVRSNARPVLLDFGVSRLRYQDKLYFSSEELYNLKEGQMREYRPWADLVRLACSVITRMDTTLYYSLNSKMGLLRVLLEMFSTEVEDIPATQDYLTVQGSLRSQFDPSDPRSKMVSFQLVAPAAERLSASVIIEPKPGTTGATAYRVLHECRAELMEYIMYAPTAEDTVVDMTLHIGRESLATEAAWKAVEKSGARTWSRTDDADDEEGSPAAKK